MKNSFKVTVFGSPYEQGAQQGEEFRILIQENVRYIKHDLLSSGLNQAAYQEATVRNKTFICKTNPEQWEEICGIADGSGLSLDDILLINIPTYFMKSSFPQECSMFLVKGNRTSDGKTYLVKNRDMEMTVHQVTVEYHYPNGNSIIEVGGAGIITYPAIGINNFGLAVTSTGTSTGIPSEIAPTKCSACEEYSSCHIFVNLHHLLHNCRTVTDILDLLKDYPRMNGLNILASDETQSAVIETTKNGYQVQWVDESGILFRTNHYCLGEYTAYNLTHEQYPSTYARYNRIETLLNGQKKKLRVQDLFQIMSDHENEPENAICRHATVEAKTRTVSCSVIVLEDREILTTPGNPCEHLVHASL